MAKALKEKTSFLKRKEADDQQQKPQKQKHDDDVAEEQQEEDITNEDVTWEELNRINERSKQLYDTSSGMLGQIKDKQDKLLMWTWKKI